MIRIEALAIVRRSSSCRFGEHDAELGAPSGLALHLQRPAVPLHDTMRHEEPEPCSLRPRREEGLEDVWELLRRDPVTPVLDLDHDGVPSRRPPVGPYRDHGTRRA